MKTVFADTVYWVAIVRPGDPRKEVALRARASLGDTLLLTTDEVLTEFLAALSAGGQGIRRQAARMVKAILASPDVKVIPQSRETFLQGVDLYEKRPDKAYSLTDCVSMNTMRAEGVSDALSNDHHFEQERFRALMVKNAS